MDGAHLCVRICKISQTPTGEEHRRMRGHRERTNVIISHSCQRTKLYKMSLYDKDFTLTFTATHRN